jgi:hypothetical protein
LDRCGGFAQVSAQRTGANLGHRRHSVVEFSRIGQEEVKNKAASGKKNWNIQNDVYRQSY